MANKLLSFVKGMNQPLVRFMVVRGWNARLKRKKLSGGHFLTLTREQKREVRRFWKPYGKRVSPDWAAYYGYGNQHFDPRYIPDSLFYGEMVNRLGNPDLTAYSYKNVQNQIFSAKQPRTIVRRNGPFLTDGAHRPLTREAAVAACRAEGHVIVKPCMGSYGSGIEFWSADESDETLLRYLDAGPIMIVQEVVRSHAFFRDIYPNALNTLRIVTLMVDHRPRVLSTILRMGQGTNRVDNYSAGGLIAVVNRDGTLRETAVQRDQRVIGEHPGGFVFRGQSVPFFDRVLDDVFEQCWRIPDFRLVSWDYAVDVDGEPVLIEANFPAGQIDLHQHNIGPMFGEITERVLDFVYKGTPLND